MPDGQTSNHKTKWLAVIIPILSAAFAVVGFIYYIGQRGSKISEVVEWKKEMAPRIERMDSTGTISFSLFHAQYDKEQAQQYERIKELEKEIRQLEVIKQKVESLERAQLDRNPRYQPPRKRDGHEPSRLLMLIVYCSWAVAACTIQIEPLGYKPPVRKVAHKKHSTKHRRAASEDTMYVSPAWLTEYHQMEAEQEATPLLMTRRFSTKGTR